MYRSGTPCPTLFEQCVGSYHLNVINFKKNVPHNFRETGPAVYYANPRRLESFLQMSLLKGSISSGVTLKTISDGSAGDSNLRPFGH